MSSIRYALLSLLAREPLSGYDIKINMNNRLSPFWKAGSNQVYPELARMEKEGLIKLSGVEQLSYRPARKLYTITEEGKVALSKWILEPVDTVENVRDDFLLKIYNAWMMDPDQLKMYIDQTKKQHEEKLAAYLDKVEELKHVFSGTQDKLFLESTISVVDFGIKYERMYIDWCNELIKKL